MKLINRFFSQRFRLADLTNYPIIGDLIDKLFFEEDNMFYLPKDSIIEMNKDIEMPDNYVLPSKIVEHFIDEANFYCIMDFCICRKTNECEDYPVDLGCLFLGGLLKISTLISVGPLQKKRHWSTLKSVEKLGSSI